MKMERDYRVKCQCLKEFRDLTPSDLGRLIVDRKIDGVRHYMTPAELSIDDEDEDDLDASVLDVETHICEACFRCDKERCPGKQLF